MKIQFEIRPALESLALIIGHPLVVFLSTIIYPPLHSCRRPKSGILQGMPPQSKILKGDKCLAGPGPAGPRQAEYISRTLLLCDKQRIVQPSITNRVQATNGHDSMDDFSNPILGFDLLHMSRYLDRALIRLSSQTWMPSGRCLLQN